MFERLVDFVQRLPDVVEVHKPGKFMKKVLDIVQRLPPVVGYISPVKFPKVRKYCTKVTRPCKVHKPGKFMKQ
jgi:hypothetical protein